MKRRTFLALLASAVSERALAQATVVPSCGSVTLTPGTPHNVTIDVNGQSCESGAAGVATSTWSAADAAANGMTLSNGGLTVNVTGASLHNTWQILRGSTSKTSGKVYVEFSTSTGQALPFHVGMASAGVNINSYLGDSNYSVGGNLIANATFVSAGFINIYGVGENTISANTVIGLAIDFTAAQIWIAINNVWTASLLADERTPSNGLNPNFTFTPATVGALFPAMAFYNGTGNDATWTLQSTAASQTYAPPSGFSAWDSAAAPTHSAQALAYLARTVGGDEGGNGANIATLIDGLVSDGVWAKLDALYVLAQQNQSDALLNLIGTSYGLSSTLLAKDTFTSYVGFGPPVSITTYFDPTSAPSPHFTQNNASYGFWSYAVVQEPYSQMGQDTPGATTIYNHFTDNNFYARLNGVSDGVPSTITKGLFVADRPDASNVYPYQNGVSGGPIAFASVAMTAGNFSLGLSPSAPSQGNQTLSAAFIGASLGAAGQLALYNRLRTYMSSVGVP